MHVNKDMLIMCHVNCDINPRSIENFAVYIYLTIITRYGMHQTLVALASAVFSIPAHLSEIASSLRLASSSSLKY